MAHHRRLPGQLSDHLGGVIGDLRDRLAGEDLGVRPRLLDGLGIVGPHGRHGGVPGLLEDGSPTVPAARQQPEPVDEHDRCPPTRVRLLDLLCFPVGHRGHAQLLPGRRVTASCGLGQYVAPWRSTSRTSAAPPS